MPIVDERTGGFSFPLPFPDNYLEDDVARLRATITALDLILQENARAIAGKASTNHDHPISGIVGLSDALAGKASTDHRHAFNDLSDLDVAEAANGMFLKKIGGRWVGVSLAVTEIPDLKDYIDRQDEAAIAAAQQALNQPITTERLADRAVTLAKQAAIATGRFMGRVSNGTGSQEALTASQVKTALGLNNVNNTADANKPVSTAMQEALERKATLGAGVSFASLLASASYLGGDSLRIARDRTGAGSAYIDFFSTAGGSQDGRIIMTSSGAMHFQSMNQLRFESDSILTTSGYIQHSAASPVQDMTRSGVRTWRTHVYSDGRWALTDTSHSDRFRLFPNGSIWTSQLGDLNTRIEAAAEGWARNLVSQIAIRRVGTTGIEMERSSGNIGTPAGTVMMGVGKANGATNNITHLLYTTLQAFDPVNGWRTMQG